MLKGDGFKAHDEKGGHRLGRQVELGPSGLGRRFLAAAAPLVIEGRVEVARRAVAEVEGKKVGRPKAVDGAPWKVEGVSKATWYRRRQGGG